MRSDAPPDPASPSRGGLVTGLLAARADPATVPLAAYNPFSLVCVERSAAWLLTNRPEPGRMRLEPGIHGLTNGPFARPWPKLAGLTAALGDWLERGEPDPEPLFAALRDDSVPAGAFDEATASPLFIRNQVYGTRCSTVVLIERGGQTTIVERRFASGGAPGGETKLTAS